MEQQRPKMRPFGHRDGAFQQQVESIKSPNQLAMKAQASGGLTSKIKLSLSKQKTRNMNVKGSQSLSFAIPLAEHNFLNI